MNITTKELRKTILESQDLKPCEFKRRDGSFYHGKWITGLEDLSPIECMIKNGILSVREQNKRGFTEEKTTNSSNGKYYVCVSSDKNNFDRVFDVNFVISEHINAIKADKHDDLARLLRDTRFEYRLGGSNNEYHVYKEIPPSYFYAIQIHLNKMLQGRPDFVMDQLTDIEYAKRIIKLVNCVYDVLEEEGLSLPLVNSDNDEVINKALFKTLK